MALAQFQVGKLSDSSNRNPAIFQEDHASAEVSLLIPTLIST